MECDESAVHQSPHSFKGNDMPDILIWTQTSFRENARRLQECTSSLYGFISVSERDAGVEPKLFSVPQAFRSPDFSSFITSICSLSLYCLASSPNRRKYVSIIIIKTNVTQDLKKDMLIC